MINKIKQQLKDNPTLGFLLKGLLIYIIWYILYDVTLLPDGRVDEYISLLIIDVSGGLLNALGFDVYTTYRVIGIGEAAGIEIVNGCNGLSAIGLFLGFVIAYPGNNKKRGLFLITGISVIYLVNILRVIVLTITQVYWPNFFDFTHDYSTTAIFYIVIFIMWVIWANFGSEEKKVEPAI